MIVEMYAARTLALAKTRGYDDAAHRAALAAADEDLVTLTHPSNFLTEDEVEGMTNCPICMNLDPMKPPHFASLACESGGRTHCACDVCF